MTPLTPNVHFRELEFVSGRFCYPAAGGPAWGYCYDVIDSCAKVLEFIHPDVDIDDVARHGDQLRRARICLTKTPKRR